jgi:hypothetical protein
VHVPQVADLSFADHGWLTLVTNGFAARLE